MAGVPQPPQEPPDTNGKKLELNHKYIIKAKAILSMYGDIPDETLEFVGYVLGDGLYFPNFKDQMGYVTEKHPSSYTYTPVPQPGGRRHKKNTRRNKNKKQTRRRKMRR